MALSLNDLNRAQTGAFFDVDRSRFVRQGDGMWRQTAGAPFSLSPVVSSAALEPAVAFGNVTAHAGINPFEEGSLDSQVGGRPDNNLAATAAMVPVGTTASAAIALVSDARRTPEQQRRAASSTGAAGTGNS